MAVPQERWCVVTGGRGFAARHLVDMLIRYEIYSVRIADLGPDIKLETHEERGSLGQALRLGRAQYISMDLRDKSQVFKGVEVVFHMAAPDSSINNYKLHHSVNVLGTKNIIDACTKLNVKRLIYTSSPGVVFDGINGIHNGEETLPYPLKAYFITNMEPIKFWEFMSLILVGLGYERPRIKIPASVMMPIAKMVEGTYNILGPYGMKVPQLTPSRIRLLTCNRTFCSTKANDHLGYVPIVPLQEGLKRTIESYSDLRAELLPRKEGPSKAAIYLGDGIVADIHVWRERRLTYTAIVALLWERLDAILQVLPFAFVVFYIYDQYEDEVDAILQTIFPVERLSSPEFLILLNPFKPIHKHG
ncbi:hypothetical protein L2E82_50484 [Cichorium intybus]|nr:hypothetical protein L2E82_50484 [Cichorium intybus]